MFKVKIGEDEYEVQFEHYIPKVDSKNLFIEEFFKETFGTTCKIYKGTSQYPIMMEFSHLNPCDNFNRNIGRKISLARALKQLFPDSPLNRFVFWQAYYEARGKKW